MARTPCEHALARVLEYLRRCGVPITRSVMLSALRLVEEVLAEEGRVGEALAEGAEGADVDVEELIARTMARLPQRFALPEPLLPQAFPRLQRGSIGYEGD